MFCKSCGTEIKDENNHCHNCGAYIDNGLYRPLQGFKPFGKFDPKHDKSSVIVLTILMSFFLFVSFIIQILRHQFDNLATINLFNLLSGFIITALLCSCALLALYNSTQKKKLSISLIVVLLILLGLSLVLTIIDFMAYAYRIIDTVRILSHYTNFFTFISQIISFLFRVLIFFSVAIALIKSNNKSTDSHLSNMDKKDNNSLIKALRICLIIAIIMFGVSTLFSISFGFRGMIAVKYIILTMVSNILSFCLYLFVFLATMFAFFNILKEHNK